MIQPIAHLENSLLPGCTLAVAVVGETEFLPEGYGVAFTFFFRDAQTLELLIEQALPALCGQAFIRIWNAGCANAAKTARCT